MWRCNRDESKFSPVEKIAWEYVLPYMHVPIIDSDEDQVRDLVKFLTNIFTTEELLAAYDRCW